MRIILGVILMLSAGPVLAQTAVETVPVKPAAPSVSIIGDAQTLGTSPSDLEVDEVKLVSVPAASSKLSGDTKRIGELITARLNDMTRTLAEAKLAAAGPVVAVFDQLGEAGFGVELMIPLGEKPQTPPGDLKITMTPTGSGIRIVHRGTYDEIDGTYDELSTFIEDRDISVQDVVIERYVGDIALGPNSGTIEIIALKK